MNRFVRLLLNSIVLWIAVSTVVLAQKAPQKKKPNLSKEAKIAEKYFENMEYFLATEYYNKSIKENPKDFYSMYQVAECYRNYFDYVRAEKAYSNVVDKAVKDFPLSRFYFASMLKNNGKYEESKDNFQKFIDEFKPETAEDEIFKKQAKVEFNGCILALNDFKKPIRNYDFKNLKTPINTTSSDYGAIIYRGDTSIVITSSRKGSKGDDVDTRMGESYSDNYKFHKNGDVWLKSNDNDNFDIINTERNDGPGAFSADFQKYFYSSCIEGECAIYLSEFKNGKWNRPKRLNENVNYPGFDNFQPTLSRNADTLIFVSKRPGGLGMHDIYYSVFTDGDWGPAVNMGPNINTPFVDLSPFYYYKDNAFFYSSSGREGFGGLDVFIATGENWKNVRNLGLPFNSNRDDFYFTLGEKMGYLSSNRLGGLGNDDIYSFSIETREAIIAMIYRDSIDKYKSISMISRITRKPGGDPAVDVEALLVDEDGNILFRQRTDKDGKVRFDNLPSNRKYTVKTDPLDPDLSIASQMLEDNFRSFSVLGNLSYKGTAEPAINVEVELVDDDELILASMRTNKEGGIRFDNINSDRNYKLRVAGADTKVTAEFDFSMDNLMLLGSTQAETKYLFENIYFDLDRFDLRSESKKVLDDLLTYLKAHPEVQVEMRANTDALGSEEYNFELSRKRGESAKDYLLSKGMESSTLVVKPMGKGVPIASNENPIGRQLNRRVEFYIVGGPGYEAVAMAYVPEAKASMDQVAQQFGMTVEELRALNARKANQIEAYEPLRVRRVGDNDIIAPVTMVASKNLPSDGLVEAVAARLAERPTDGNFQSSMGDEKMEKIQKSSFSLGALAPGEEYYVVEPENTLYSISRQYGMKADELKALNNLKSNILQIGQRIKVRRAPDIVVDATQYAVKEGDTLFDIAQKHGLTVEELKRLNNLDSNMLFERMVLRVKPQ